MIYITGDTHGDFFRISKFCERMNTTKEDILIILGDAGLNFWLNKSDYKSLRITKIILHTSHENRIIIVTKERYYGFHI